MNPLISKIAGCGSYLPQRVLTNDELATKVDTSDAWIVERTGIHQRHIAAEGEFTSDLAFKAAERALADAGLVAKDVDMIVVATTTPDNTFPSVATQVQAKLGLGNGAAFDVQAACSGFIYGLAVADNFVKAGQARTVLVIGAETMSRILDWKDRATCVLFGDGAGAVVLVAAENDLGNPGHSRTGNSEARGILSTHLHSDGSLADLLYVDGGPSTSQATGYLRMQGREVFRRAVVNLTDVVLETIAANGLTADDIDWVVPHQANKRILDGTARKLKLPPERIVVTIDRHANTSAASIPLALDVAVRDGRIKDGQLILMEAMGGGMTWGAGLVRW
ncbi:MAG: beta-ketoacyl-ACP synthase III [Rhodospirillales bacterium]|nr:beta-ketoacyl-ACP synthase III [Rhodospirillales bacterium]